MAGFPNVAGPGKTFPLPLSTDLHPAAKVRRPNVDFSVWFDSFSTAISNSVRISSCADFILGAYSPFTQ